MGQTAMSYLYIYFNKKLRSGMFLNMTYSIAVSNLLKTKVDLPHMSCQILKALFRPQTLAVCSVLI